MPLHFCTSRLLDWVFFFLKEKEREVLDTGMHCWLITRSKTTFTKPRFEVKAYRASSVSLAERPRPMEGDTRNLRSGGRGSPGPHVHRSATETPGPLRPPGEPLPATLGPARAHALPPPQAGGTLGGRILQMPVFSARPRMRPMKPSGSLNSSQLGSNTGHSGGGTNSAA